MNKDESLGLLDPIPGAAGLGVETIAPLVVAVALLLIVIVRLLHRRGGATTREAVGVELLDADFIDQLASAAPADRVLELFDAMADDCRRCIQDIRRAAKESNFDQMSVECQILAESCEAFGALGLARHARRLGEASINREFKAAGRLLVDIDGTADRTFHMIHKFLKSGARRRAG